MKMNYFLNHLLTVTACLTMTGAYAGGCSTDKSDSSVRSKEPMLKKHEVNARVKASSEQKMSGEWGAKNPTSYGCPPNEGFIVTLDYLIMRARNENLSYAYEAKTILTDGSVFVSSRQGSFVNPIRTWRPGFKISLGWHTPFDHWDSDVEWTYYYNKSVTNRAADDVATGAAATVTGFLPYWGMNVDVAGDIDGDGFYQNLHADWHLNYNMLDWELGRSIYLTKAFALRPIIGIRNGWIHQRFDVEYNRSYSATGANRPLNLRILENNNFWGIGLRTGLDSEWELGGGFSFLGKFTASLLSGRTNTRRTQLASITPIGAEPVYETTNNDKNRLQQIAPNLELNMGLGWGTCLSNDTMYLGFDVTWQTVYWWGQFSFIQPSSSPLVGSNETLQQHMAYPFTDKALNLEGISIRGRFDF